MVWFMVQFARGSVAPYTRFGRRVSLSLRRTAPLQALQENSKLRFATNPFGDIRRLIIREAVQQRGGGVVNLQQASVLLAKKALADGMVEESDQVVVIAVHV